MDCRTNIDNPTLDNRTVAHLTATPFISAPVAEQLQPKPKRTKACNSCRHLRCKCVWRSLHTCETCDKRKRECSGPTETPEKLAKMKEIFLGVKKTVKRRRVRPKTKTFAHRAPVIPVVEQVPLEKANAQQLIGDTIQVQSGGAFWQSDGDHE